MPRIAQWIEKVMLRSKGPRRLNLSWRTSSVSTQAAEMAAWVEGENESWFECAHLRFKAGFGKNAGERLR